MRRTTHVDFYDDGCETGLAEIGFWVGFYRLWAVVGPLVMRDVNTQ